MSTDGLTHEHGLTHEQHEQDSYADLVSRLAQAEAKLDAVQAICDGVNANYMPDEIDRIKEALGNYA